jgi:hypothetical protein
VSPQATSTMLQIAGKKKIKIMEKVFKLCHCSRSANKRNPRNSIFDYCLLVAALISKMLTR